MFKRILENSHSGVNKSIQLDHPLNKVSEKLFEDSVNKLFKVKDLDLTLTKSVMLTKSEF